MSRAGLLAGGLMVVALLGSVASKAETLIIEADVWCPVNCDPKSDKPGVFVELAKEIFAESGIAVEYRASNWARSVQDVRSGRVNGLIGAGVHDAPDLLFGKEAPGLSRMCFYAPDTSTWRYTGIESLAKIRLGAINGYSYGEELDQYISKHHNHMDHLQLVAGDQALAQNVRKVELGRVDATVENTWIMGNFLAVHNTGEDLIEVGCRPKDVPIYIAFSPALPGSAKHLEIFDEGIRRYRENGRLNAILRSYGITPGD